ncbi:MAG: hypothetical protein ACQERT_10680 [Thermodesulfobacteriota bacterium]
MGWTFWLAIIVVIGDLAAVHVWEKRSNRGRELTEEEMLLCPGPVNRDIRV